MTCLTSHFPRTAPHTQWECLDFCLYHRDAFSLDTLNISLHFLLVGKVSGKKSNVILILVSL